jgi:hypothetical protein
MMAPEKTGNVLLAMPTVDQAPNLRELYKKQNSDSSISLVMGFTSKYDGLYLSEEHTAYLRQKSKEVYEKIMSFKTAEEFDAYAAGMATVINGDTMLRDAMGSIKIENPVDATLEPYETLSTLYSAWLANNKLVSSSD